MRASFATEVALDTVFLERVRQHEKWGVQSHPSGTGDSRWFVAAEGAKRDYEAASKDGSLTWRHILHEEVLEAFAESDPEKLRNELIQVAAVAVAWVEHLDRRGSE